MPKIIQIASNNSRLYGLDDEGAIWYYIPGDPPGKKWNLGEKSLPNNN